MPADAVEETAAGDSSFGWSEIAFAAVPGIAFFFIVFGMNPLVPTHIRWLLQGDSATHYIGWEFFRNHSWSVPLGLSPDYGMEMGSSIVFSDSIPGVAMIMKVFAAVLPIHFQYTGWWVFSCFVLQGLVAWRLAALFSMSRLQCLLFSCFAVVAPVMFVRSPGHYALMAQWIVLLALYLYLRPDAKRRDWHWMLLLVAASLTHAYLLYLVIAIWVADLVRGIRTNDRRTIAYTLGVFVGGVVSIGLLTWLAGYWVIGLQNVARVTPYGTYGVNLATLWLPGWMAPGAPNEPLPATDMEGYVHLGFGMLAMLPLAGWGFSKSPPTAATLRLQGPLIGVLLILVLLALSDRIAFGGRIFSLGLPEVLRSKLDFIRASGRLFWPAYYGIILAIFALISTRIDRKFATPILVLAFGVQVIEFSSPYANVIHTRIRSSYGDPPDAPPSPLKSPFWEAAASRYHKVLFVPMEHMATDWHIFALWAADHRMAINVGYFARINLQRITSAAIQQLRAVQVGRLDPDALYIIRDFGMVDQTVFTPIDGFGKVDGFGVLAPNWFAGPPNRNIASNVVFGPVSPASTETVVEYYDVHDDIYFIAADRREIGEFDSGIRNKGPSIWSRTGHTFKAYVNSGQGDAVCRFYDPDAHPLGVYFYTANSAECANVRQTLPTWRYETGNAFNIVSPANGVCPIWYVPVHRYFSERDSKGWRYITATSVHDAMLSKGWKDEGVQMCSPP